MKASEFHLVQEHGWRTGFTNLMRREISYQWSIRNLLIHGVVWLVLLNLVLALVIELESNNNTITTSISTFVFIASLLPPIGIIVLSQGAILNERQSGTAAWVLSKPTTRTAFVVSKLIVMGVGFLLIAMVLQSLFAYSQLSLAQNQMLPVGPFLSAIFLLSLNIIFYLCLTIMLGTFFDRRLAILGIPVALVILQAFTVGLLSRITDWLPYIFPGSLFEISTALMIDQGTQYWLLPIVTTLALSALFVYIAIRRFKTEEL
jgi:ABC-2 type transport system permease protein